MRRALMLLWVAGLVTSGSAHASYLHEKRALRAVTSDLHVSVAQGYVDGFQVTHLHRSNGHGLYAYLRLTVPLLADGQPGSGSLTAVDHVVLHDGVITVKTLGYTGEHRERL